VEYTKDGRTDELKKGRTTVGWKGVNKGEGGWGEREREREGRIILKETQRKKERMSHRIPFSSLPPACFLLIRFSRKAVFGRTALA
jgi:hypothetical protein